MHTKQHLLPVGHSSVEVSSTSREQPSRPTPQDVAVLASIVLLGQEAFFYVSKAAVAKHVLQLCSYTSTHLMTVRRFADLAFHDGELFKVATTYNPTELLWTRSPSRKGTRIHTCIPTCRFTCRHNKQKQQTHNYTIMSISQHAPMHTYSCASQGPEAQAAV